MNQTQETLLRKAEETIRAAAWLISGGFHAHAVSRVYYAMFYAAQALLLERGLTFSKHASTVAAFGQYFVKTGLLNAQLHQNLKRAFDKRLVGDYDIGVAVTAAEATTLLQQAEEFVETIACFIEQASQSTASSVSHQAAPTIPPTA